MFVTSLTEQCSWNHWKVLWGNERFYSKGFFLIFHWTKFYAKGVYQTGPKTNHIVCEFFNDISCFLLYAHAPFHEAVKKMNFQQAFDKHRRHSRKRRAGNGSSETYVWHLMQSRGEPVGIGHFCVVSGDLISCQHCHKPRPARRDSWLPTSFQSRCPDHRQAYQPSH